MDTEANSAGLASQLPTFGKPSSSLGKRQFLIGLLLVLCALSFYYAAVLKINYADTALLDLRPYPDAAEYFAQAKSLAKGDGPMIQIGFDKLPSRYPAGYPMLMLPWLKCLSASHSILAPFRTNQTIGLCLLLCAFAFYCYLGRPVAGGLATLLLSTLPAFFTYCRSSLSEISAATLVALAFAFVFLGLTHQRRWQIYVGGALLGLALNIRTQTVLFGPLLLAMAVFPGKWSRLNHWAHCAAVLVVFCLAASPTFTLNALQFHDPLKTGYDFWVPRSGSKHLLFSAQYASRHLTMLWKHFALERVDFNAANPFGTGTYYVPAYVLLILAGLYFVPISRFTICAFVAVASFFLFTLAYRYVDGRFYVPLLVLGIAIAVLPVEWAASRVTHGRHKFTALLVLVLFAAACFGYPSQSGFRPMRNGCSQAWDALHFTVPRRLSARFLAQKRLVQVCGRSPGIVFSNLNPVYLNAVLPASFVATPLNRYGFSKIYHPPDAVALAQDAIAKSTPVYAVFVTMRDVASAEPRLPRVNGYDWNIISVGKQGVVLHLAPKLSVD